MADFLLELLSEEIPARMQRKARDDLARLFADELAKAGLAASRIETFATPRRLALIARDLPAATQATTEEVKGPRADAPPQALAGFLGKTGLAREQLVERTDAKGNAVLFAVTERPGRATTQVLADAIPAIVRGFPWPKSMRWGAGPLRWVRPLAGIVALLGEDVVPCEIDSIVSGAATLGHRFHHPGQITIGSAADYAEKLRLCHVIVSADERADIIRAGAETAAAAAGLSVVPDEGLVAENAGLTEWPVTLLGRFDPAFLDVPREVVQLTMRTNQKYFACVDGAGRLAPNFICTANIDAADGGALVVAGNEKVLSARLSDARFFWEQDLKVPLAVQAEKLSGIVFHEKLGTVADKVERVAKLARWLVEEGIVSSSPARGGGPFAPSANGGGGFPPDAAQAAAPLHPASHGPPPRAGEDLAALAEQAARLCKADLVTGMVGEFPELQGVIGGHLARAQGFDPRIADAIRDHYKPAGQGDDVPTAPVTVAVSLADKLDTLTGFFAINERPTGSKDPFALRRAAIAILRLMLENNLRWGLGDLVREARFELIESLAVRYAIVNIDEGQESSEASPVLPAWSQLTTAGDVFAVSWDSDPQTFITVDDASYPAFSRDYIEEHGLAKILIESLVELVGVLVQYLGDRLSEAERSRGIRVDLIRCILPKSYIAIDYAAIVLTIPPRTRGRGVQQFRVRNWTAPDDPVAVLARVHALQAFITTDDGANLLAGYKRAANILRIEEKRDGSSEGGSPAQAGAQLGRPRGGEVTTTSDVFQLGPGLRRGTEEGRFEEAEAALVAALDAAEPAAARAVEDEDFTAAMTALATLRGPIDAFFNQVTVNDPDPTTRAARLALLARIRDAVHRVADFSKIEG